MHGPGSWLFASILYVAVEGNCSSPGAEWGNFEKNQRRNWYSLHNIENCLLQIWWTKSSPGSPNKAENALKSTPNLD